jgi:uncharacterized protein (UPF0332 family)
MSPADEKIVVAQKLFDLSYFDDTTSRAYYGMFYAAKAILLSIDIDVKSHAGVLNQFSQYFIKPGRLDKKYGRMFALAQRAREMSDYNPEISVSQNDAQKAIVTAQIFVEKMKELLGDVLKK